MRLTRHTNLEGRAAGEAGFFARHFPAWACLAPTLLVAFPSAFPQARAQESAAERFVRASAGAKVYNWQDTRSKVITELQAGALLQVHDEARYEGAGRAWLEVSAPGGFPVWVYGQYLAETGTPNVLRCTASGVRMRPSPDSSVDSMPLGTMLDPGDLVQFVERNDGSKPMAEDWVRVWAPNARAFVAAETVRAENDRDAALAQWKADRRVLADVPLRQASTNKPAANKPAAGAARPGAQDVATQEAAAPATRIPDEAYRSLNYGNTLLGNAMKKGKAATEADFDPAIRAYRVVLDMVPENSTVAASARDRLEQAEAHQTIAAAREELAQAEAHRVEWLEELKKDREARTMAETAHWGRFMGRGWVESKQIGVETRWFLRWSGEITFEIACQSGRYDLALYEGYEIGVRGSLLRERILPTEETQAQEALIDVSRIEVISGAPRR